MSDEFDPTSVPIQSAATVMMIRAGEMNDDGSSIEVFMLRRTGTASFGAGMYVFPGGRVDDVDAAAGIEPYCRGLDDASASAQLGLDAGGLAYWVASIRECFEEAGILLATKRDGSDLELNDHDRHAVHDGTLSMIELCRRDDLVLELSTTQYVDHWITPLGEKRRFDTRFFVTEAPPGQQGLHDDKETVDSLWVEPSVALQMMEAGELQMMPPTVANLRWLTQFSTPDEAVAAGEALTEITPILPKLLLDESGRIAGISRPGDADYDDIVVVDPHMDARR